MSFLSESGLEHETINITKKPIIIILFIFSGLIIQVITSKLCAKFLQRHSFKDEDVSFVKIEIEVEVEEFIFLA